MPPRMTAQTPSKVRGFDLPRGSAETIGRYLFWLIVVATVVRGLAGTRVPLIDDEAYYWLWAHHLDWSYLDHPPMIAYLIFLTTRLGSNAIWIRMGPLLLGAATTYALFLFGRDLFGTRAGFIAALLFQIVPVLAGGALLATPDAPLFLAWTLAMRLYWQALHGKPRRWVTAGLALGVGLLSKLSMVFLPIGVALYILLHARRWLARPQPYGAAALALVVFLPVIYWNFSHNWAMVRFILYQRPGGTPHGFAGVGELLLQQFAFALVLFPAFAYALYLAWRHRRDERYGYLFWTSFPVIAVTALLAAATGAPHGNWLGPGYLGLAILLGARWNRTTAVLGACSALVLLYGFVLPFVSALPPLPGAEEIYGWKEVAARVEAERAGLVGDLGVVADRYQVAAQLAYYTRATIPVTLLPCPNPASIWPRTQEFRARDAIAVIDARWTPLVHWNQFANRVEEARPLAVEFHGRPLRTFRILRLYGVSLAPGCRSPAN